MMEVLLREGHYPAIATHDPTMHRRARQLRRPSSASARIASSSRCCTASAAICRRRSSRTATACAIYIPFGRQWFPYFMRRLGERPANVGFVLRGILSER